MADIQKKPITKSKPPLPLWQAILLIILLTIGIVVLFGLLIYLFVGGAQQMGGSLIMNLSIVVIISGIFAWLIKRLTDIVSGLGQLWFSENQDDERP